MPFITYNLEQGRKIIVLYYVYLSNTIMDVGQSFTILQMKGTGKEPSKLLFSLFKKSEF